MNKRYPYGHPDFNALMLEQIALHSMKNEYYNRDSNPLGNFNRTASILSQYPSFPPNHYTTAMLYMLKHLDKIMWDISHAVEPSDESLGDIAVYATIMRCMNKEARK